MELIADLEKVYPRSKQVDKDLTAALTETGSTLMSLKGIGPTGAAKLLVEVGRSAEPPRPSPTPSEGSKLNAHRKERPKIP